VGNAWCCSAGSEGLACSILKPGESAVVLRVSKLGTGAAPDGVVAGLLTL
jgi:hypothetical protein